VSKNNILNNDKIEESKQNKYNIISVYVNKEKMERLDNKLLYNTVKKYNEDDAKKNLKDEFKDVFIIKRKGKLIISDGPDLSRRNKK
jgi:hypothetical protein